MTNVVKKGANRASHNARTAKAAQRTPLPPRGKAGVAGKGVTAKVLKEEVDKVAAKKAAKKAAAKKAAPASAKKAVSPTARTRKPAAQKAAKTEAPQGSSVKPEWPGAAKGQAFIDYATPHGWVSKVAYPNKADYVITTSKSDESIVIKFFDGRQDYAPENLPMWKNGSREVCLRNVGGARGHVDGSRPVKRDAVKRTTRAAASEEVEQQRASRMGDIDLNAMDEEQFLLFVAGRQVTWKMTGLPEQQDRVLPAVYCPECQSPRGDSDGKKSSCHDRDWKVQRAWKVEAHPRNGKRIFHFTSAVSLQYRAVYVDAIVDVS